MFVFVRFWTWPRFFWGIICNYRNFSFWWKVVCCISYCTDMTTPGWHQQPWLQRCKCSPSVHCFHLFSGILVPSDGRLSTCSTSQWMDASDRLLAQPQLAGDPKWPTLLVSFRASSLTHLHIWYLQVTHPIKETLVSYWVPRIELLNRLVVFCCRIIIVSWGIMFPCTMHQDSSSWGHFF